MTIGNSVTNIGEVAFNYCTSLTNVMIGNSVSDIGFYAFGYCTSLTNVTIPNSVTNIGNYAFRCCTSLINVTIGHQRYQHRGTMPSIAAQLDQRNDPQQRRQHRGSAFVSAQPDRNNSGCDNSAYSSVDGVLFDKSQTVLIQYPGGQSR